MEKFLGYLLGFILMLPYIIGTALYIILNTVGYILLIPGRLVIFMSVMIQVASIRWANRIIKFTTNVQKAILKNEK